MKETEIFQKNETADVEQTLHHLASGFRKNSIDFFRLQKQNRSAGSKLHLYKI